MASLCALQASMTGVAPQVRGCPEGQRAPGRPHPSLGHGFSYSEQLWRATSASAGWDHLAMPGHACQATSAAAK